MCVTLRLIWDPLFHRHNKKSIVKSAKSCFWRSFNIFMSNFGQLSYTVKCKLFNQYFCYFYGSQLCSLKSTLVESMCVDWRIALRSLWRVDPRPHCDLITAVSNQILLILSLKKKIYKMYICMFKYF